MSEFAIYGLIAGALLMLAYFGLCAKFRAKPELTSALLLLLSAGGMASGVKICVLSLSKPFREAVLKVPNMGSDDFVYFLFGGFALVWLSIEAIWGVLKTVWSPKRR